MVYNDLLLIKMPKNTIKSADIGDEWDTGIKWDKGDRYLSLLFSVLDKVFYFVDFEKRFWGELDL